MISAEFRHKTFDMFVSDSEKEGFLKEFKHIKELIGFYVSRGRFTEAFEYAAKTGRLEKTLGLVLDQHRAATNPKEAKEFQSQLSDVFKYVQTEKLLINMSKAAPGHIDMNHEPQFSGFGWSRPWEDLVAAANDCFKTGIKPKRDSIQECWIREYLDTIVSSSTITYHFISVYIYAYLFPQISISIGRGYFLQQRNLADFPLEYLSGLSEMARRASQHGMTLPKSVLICFGVFPLAGKSDSYVVLTWSDLPMDHQSPRTLDYDGVLKKVIAYISGRVHAAGYSIDQRALKLWVDPSDMWNCTACVCRGMFLTRNFLVCLV